MDRDKEGNPLYAADDSDSLVLPAARIALRDPSTNATVTIALSRDEKVYEHRVVTSMSTETADALKEIARYTHAIPARQETLRKKEDTAQLTRVCIVVAIAILAAAIRPEAAYAIASIVGVLAAGEAANRLVSSRKKALPQKQESPKDDHPVTE